MAAPWSEEEDDFLKRAAENRHSSNEIAQLLAEVFGTNRTRSAVCGRASRLCVELNSDLAMRGVAKRSKAGRQERLAQAAAEPDNAVSSGRVVAKRAAPKSEPTLPALRPPAKQKQNAHNIKVSATRHLDARFDAIRTARLAEVAAFEAKLAKSGGVNPGVLFLERDMTKHCCAPMAGWDDAPIDEKRVCGAPVEWRSVQVGGSGISMEPTSWCSDCRKRFTITATERRADLGKLASLDKSVRRAAA